jgi:hypothetical protein
VKQQILTLLEQHGSLAAEQIAARLHEQPDAVQNALRLHERSLIDVLGPRVAGQKAGALHPFGPWFVQPSARCFCCRRWRYGATGGTTTQLGYALAKPKSPRRVIGMCGSRWNSALGPGMSVAAPPLSGRIATQAVSAAPWAAARSGAVAVWLSIENGRLPRRGRLRQLSAG